MVYRTRTVLLPMGRMIGRFGRATLATVKNDTVYICRKLAREMFSLEEGKYVYYDEFIPSLAKTAKNAIEKARENKTKKPSMYDIILDRGLEQIED